MFVFCYVSSRTFVDQAKMMKRVALRAQRRGNKEVADRMRKHGLDETVCFHEERKRFLDDRYHFKDFDGQRDAKFDRRLDVFQKMYEDQEMDGGCRFMMNKEQEAAESKIYQLAVRAGRPISQEEHVRIHARIEEAKKRIIRKYKGIDADLRSGDEYCVRRAQEYLHHVNSGGAENKWDYARAAHKRLQASLKGTPKDEKRAAADNEMEGRPDADGSVLSMFDEVGFMEKDEFAMLRREVGEEIADEYVVNLQKAREEVARKRLQHVSDRTKLNQLEKKMVLQEYQTVFDGGFKMNRRAQSAAETFAYTKANVKEYEQFENEHSLSGEGDLNRSSHDMVARMRKKRLEIIKDRNKGKPAPEVGSSFWESTAGQVQNPEKGFVDPDWWELATDDPRLRRHYMQALKRDAREARKGDDSVTLRKQTGDDILAAMEDFNNFRKDNFTRGYSKSQVLAYNDPRTNEPRNDHIEDALGISIVTGRPYVPEVGKGTRLLRWELAAAERRHSEEQRGPDLPPN
eukprot:TRINITY_DN46740_c0_g1_i1.p1 TRINITY_DN46740_c0_g1~~TRINITY_DN46740_c0_g1_i1.p1  ORF type:complete len:516 (+),score=180.25 TRINITY_DN46740_c0_g1_i1:53-1600(+)